jgi:hypothetical protein
MLDAGHAMAGTPVQTWPWTWLYLVSLVKQVRSVHERAAYDKDPKTALPPRWMFWDAEALDEWFDMRRK